MERQGHDQVLQKSVQHSGRKRGRVLAAVSTERRDPFVLRWTLQVSYSTSLSEKRIAWRALPRSLITFVCAWQIKRRLGQFSSPSSPINLRDINNKLDRPVIPFTRQILRGWSQSVCHSFASEQNVEADRGSNPFATEFVSVHDRLHSSQAIDVRVLAHGRSHGSRGLSVRSQREDVGKQHETTLSSRSSKVLRTDHHHRGLLRSWTLGRSNERSRRGSGRGKHRELLLQREMHPRRSDERERLPLRRPCVRQSASFQQSRP